MTGVRVGFVGGHDLPGNVRTFLENVRQLLASQPTEFECDLVLSDDVYGPDGFGKVDPGLGASDTARSELVDLTKAIRLYARQAEPDVLFQVTRFPTHGTATAIAGRSTGTCAVTRLAGANFEEYRFAMGYEEKLKTFVLKNCIGLAAVHLADDVVVLGPEGRQTITRRGRRQSVHEIPQPVDTGRFYPVGDSDRNQIRNKLGMPPLGEERVFLTVGRVSRRKGILDLVGTAQSLARWGEPIRWYVVGDGPLQSELAEIPLVEAVGRIDNERMPEFYRAADLYVHPSLHEGLPNVLLEATACGTPSVARNVGECRQVATTTFDDPRELPALLAVEYNRVKLDERFTGTVLAEKYERLLTTDTV